MSIVAQSSLIYAQTSGAVNARKATEQYHARAREDQNAYAPRKIEQEPAGQRQAPVDKVEIRNRTDEKRELQAEMANRVEARKRAEQKSDVRRAEHAREDQHRAEMREQAEQRREAPRASERRYEAPGSRLDISA